jgi:hypothetical protein
MAKTQTKILFVLLIIFLFSCKDNDFNSSLEQTLRGSWILYERGYSPGSGYIVNQIPDKPAQVIIFKSNNEMSTTIEGMTDFKFFLVAFDSIAKQKVLALYQDFPTDDLKNPPKYYNHSYTVREEGDKLKLYFRFCIEGCHMAFKRLK